MQEQVNIFRNADIYNCTSCVHDSRLGYYVSWETNNDLNEYGTVEGITSHTVWDGVYFGVTTSGTCYISQDNDISVDASDYNVFKINMRLDTGYHIEQPTIGKIEFRTSSEDTWSSDKSSTFAITPDNAYHEYTVDMSTHTKWEGTVTRFRLYPMTDGVEGTKIHIKNINIESRTKYACDSYLGSTVCSMYYDYSHPCPWIGSPGQSVSISLDNGISIVRGVNDKLLVDIDGYGNQAITLRAVLSANISDIARDIQDKLNLIGVGGYALARCYEDDYKIVIESDWHSSSSSVVVSQPSSNSCGVTLGFFDDSGNKVATESLGTNSASVYERYPLQINSSSIGYLKNTSGHSDKSAFSVTGDSYSPQAGFVDYDTVVRDTKLEFEDKTLIDYDNPVSNNGIITFVGYSGDAYSNTEFRVYRQKLDGSFYLVDSVDMSQTPNSEDKVFEKDSINIHVKKGDLLSLYSAALHTGSSNTLGNFSYILYDGDMSDGTVIQPLYGKGDKGLPLFARGGRKNNSACLDIVFDHAHLLESIVIHAEEETVAEEINLCTVRNGGLNGGPYVTGTTGNNINGVQAPDLENLSALIDGDKQDINSESEYCYPGWLDLPQSEQSDYDYTDFQIAFDFAKGIDVYFSIYKIKMYFVDNKNIKSFRWEIPKATNPEDTIRIWDTGWSTYTAVYTDEGLMDAEEIYLYNNPSIVLAGDYQLAYSHLDYRYLELIFDEYMARSVRYNATIGEDPEIDETQLSYSYFPVADSPKIQEIEVYSRSLPEKSIASNFTILSEREEDQFLTHLDVDEISSTNVKYIVGRPVTHIRLEISADATMKVYDIHGVVSEDPITIDTNYTGTMSLNAPIDAPSGYPEVMTVTNDSADTSNFYIDVFDEHSKYERCILWNKMGTSEEVAQSEIGPGGIIRRRSNRFLRPHNYAYNCPGYYLNTNFIYGQPAFMSLNSRVSWISLGASVTDSSDSSYVTNENSLFYLYPIVYVAVDLGNNYNISSVELHYPSGTTSFSSDVLYSSMETTDPANIPLDPNNPNGWNIGAKYTARWILMQAPAVQVGDVAIRYLSYVTVNIDFTNSYNLGKVPWTSANGYLTNGLMGRTSQGQEEGWISDGQASYFCVNLKWWHNVTNVITGPLGSAVTSIDDTDMLEPGTWPSIVDSSGIGFDVAYSKSATDNPSEVVWSDFGVAPDNPVKWIMVKTDTRIEEIIAHIDNNESNDKESFLNSAWFTSAGTDVYQEFVETRSGICAIAMDYPSNNNKTEEYILFKQSFGYDEELAKRDALGFWLYISDVSQLDSTHGYIRLGRSKTQTNTPLDINLDLDNYNYYQWDFSDLVDIIEDGWNYLSLPFSDNYRNGYLYIAEDDRSRISSSDSTTRDRITYIKFAFRGSTNDNDEVTVRLDDFRLLRRNFSSTLFNGGAYIPKAEYIKFPLNDFNPFKGTIEFYIRPDWARSLLCNSCSDPRDHSIVRIYSTEDNYTMGLFMTGGGLQFYMSDGSDNLFLTDNSDYSIPRDVPTHVAITWDIEDEYGSAPYMGIYINNSLSVAYEKSDIETFGTVLSIAQNSIYTLLLGATAWDGVVSQFSSSVDGVIDNLKVYNYPITDFSYSLNNENIYQAKRGSELIELSFDGVTYYSYKDRGAGLPLFKQNVPAGDSFTVYVRGIDLDKTYAGEKNRKSHITITRTPT